MEKQPSAKTLQKRKFLMVLPLLVLPFITLAFWSLGGGNTAVQAAVTESQSGFNTDLPEAKFSSHEKQDKFSIYEASKKNKVSNNDADILSALSFSNSNEEMLDSSEERIHEKLTKIDEQIKISARPPEDHSPRETAAYENSSKISEDVDRLEKLMLAFQTDEDEDKEMEQLNTVLDKIIKIQYPDLETEEDQLETTEKEVGAYVGNDRKTEIDEIGNKVYRSNTIQATIHEDQDIVSGSVIKLRILDSMAINGLIIPKNRFVYGVATIDDERLKVEIASLRYQNSILSVSLSAYDLDGLEGLYIPGAITRDASKEGMNDAIQSLRVMSLDPSLSAQVADAGVHATKGLFRKKVKQVRVKVKAGYQLLLRDKNVKNK